MIQTKNNFGNIVVIFSSFKTTPGSFLVCTAPTIFQHVLRFALSNKTMQLCWFISKISEQKSTQFETSQRPCRRSRKPISQQLRVKTGANPSNKAHIHQTGSSITIGWHDRSWMISISNLSLLLTVTSNNFISPYRHIQWNCLYKIS